MDFIIKRIDLFILGYRWIKKQKINVQSLKKFFLLMSAFTFLILYMKGNEIGQNFICFSTILDEFRSKYFKFVMEVSSWSNTKFVVRIH